MLVLQGLQLTKTMEEMIHVVKECMGVKNVASYYFPKQRGALHGGSVNIECLNATFYHQFVNQTHKIHSTHITFTPHPRSLEGSLKPSKEEKERHGFCDINTALANTIEAIQNAPSAQ